MDTSGCPRCAKRSKGKAAWQVFSEHTKAVHKIVTAAGKRMIMWGDHIDSQPKLLDVLAKDIVLANWQYRKVDPAPIRRALRKGFEVICVPAMLHFGDMIQPNARNFDNMDQMVTLAGELAPRGVLGMVNSWWVP